MNIKKTLYIAAIFAAVLCTSYSAKIHIKAWCAQGLIKLAWERQQTTGLTRKPWPWADMAPIAKLHIPSLNNTWYVLSDGGGESLAFGPSYIAPSAKPNQLGTTVIAGHNDTHFKDINKLVSGDIITLSNEVTYQYQVIDKHIVTIDDKGWLISPDANQLHLITCYQSNYLLPRVEKRLIVIAKRL